MSFAGDVLLGTVADIHTIVYFVIKGLIFRFVHFFALLRSWTFGVDSAPSVRGAPESSWNIVAGGAAAVAVRAEVARLSTVADATGRAVAVKADVARGCTTTATVGRA
jgi:hypothetical protein